MDRKLLITEARDILNAAEAQLSTNNNEGYTVQMEALIELLSKGISPEAPAEPETQKQDGQA